MPTRGRQQWAALAVDCYRSQTYPAKELVILDDAEEPSFPEGIVASDIVYQRSVCRSIPQKRNLINRLSTGDIIAHFDSDDWSSPERLQLLMDLHESSKKAVVGFHTMYAIRDKDVWYYRTPGGFVIGTSLLYTRDFFNRRPFIEGMHRGSDTNFTMAAIQNKDVAGLLIDGHIVARYHAGNTTPKDIRPPSYRKVEWSALPSLFQKLCLEKSAC